MSAPVVQTLTGNLLAEHTLDFATWNPGKTQRARSQTFQVGGKGINVSKMLARLGSPTLALCFAGGNSGNACRDWLRQSAIPFHAFTSETETRSGFVVRGEATRETTFLGPDCPVGPAALDAAAQHIADMPAHDALAFCGSFPGFTNAPATPLREALDRRLRLGKVFVDTYGPPLAWWIERPVTLVKINRDEFDLLFGESARLTGIETRLAEALERWPVQAWIVTNGAKEIHVAERGQPTAVFHPLLVKEISATGSGDVFFAALLHAHLACRQSLKESVKFAIPYGAANAASPGVADFDLNLVPSLRSDTA